MCHQQTLPRGVLCPAGSSPSACPGTEVNSKGRRRGTDTGTGRENALTVSSTDIVDRSPPIRVKRRSKRPKTSGQKGRKHKNADPHARSSAPLTLTHTRWLYEFYGWSPATQQYAFSRPSFHVAVNKKMKFLFIYFTIFVCTKVSRTKLSY